MSIKNVVVVLFAATTFLIYCFYYVYKFRNPYKLVMIFGKKGCGKSTYACKLAYEYKKKGWNVFSNMYIKGVNYFDINKLETCTLPENSLLIVDEAGITYNNRNYKDFKQGVVIFYKMQRHERVACYLFSQSFDVDLKLRDLTDRMYLMTNLFGICSYLKQIRKYPTIRTSEASAGGELVDAVEFTSFLGFPFGSRKICWIPKWYKNHDSFNKLDREKVPFKVLDGEIKPDTLSERFKKIGLYFKSKKRTFVLHFRNIHRKRH